MLFNSFEFLILFLPLVLFTSLFLQGRTLLVFVTLASFVFYAFAGHVWFLAPMLVTTCLDFWLAKKITAAESQKKKNVLLTISLTCNLGLLAFFKYGRLLSETVASASNHAFAPPEFLSKIILPAGISFYTFQSMGYMIDVWRSECPAEKDFWLFSGFITFFPHLVAGPLTRHNQLIPQLKKISSEGIRPEWTEGVTLFSIGLCKKVILGDSIGRCVENILESMPGGNIGFTGAWLAAVGYGFRIYFDFSGYSDMAVGLGLMFGIRLPQNFNSPFKAVSLRDYWNRWHMTLSSWLKDYLYVSLGGSRRGAWRTKINLMITMGLGGLWHGANWMFVIWGLYHGFIMAMTRSWDKSVKPWHRPLTFLFVTVGWVFFRSPDFAMAKSWFGLMVGANGIERTFPMWDYWPLIGWVIVSFGITQFMKNTTEFAPQFCVKFYRRASLAAAVVLALTLLTRSDKFLYFQF